MMGEIEFIPVDDGCDPLECYRFVEVFFDVGFGALTFIGDIGWRRKGEFFSGDPVELQKQNGQIMLADFLIGSLFFCSSSRIVCRSERIISRWEESWKIWKGEKVSPSWKRNCRLSIPSTI